MAKGGSWWVQPPGVPSAVSMAREAHLCGLCPVCALSLIPTGVCPHPPPGLFLLDRAGHRIGRHMPPELTGNLSEQLGLVMTRAQRATPLQEFSRVQKHLRAVTFSSIYKPRARDGAGPTASR